MLNTLVGHKAFRVVTFERLWQLRAGFWLLAISLGFIQAWLGRYFIHSDGLSYLEIARAYLRGDWSLAINPYWSPLYSWLIGLGLLVFRPGLSAEVHVIQFTNYVIYLFALASFTYFLRELAHFQKKQSSKLSGTGYTPLPEWVIVAVGYTLFIWFSLEWIVVTNVSPEMLLSVIVYLIGGIILQIARGDTRWRAFVALGLLLGIGSLAKTPVFFLAFPFLGVSLFASGNFRHALPRALVALALFVLVYAPYIALISNAKGRFTIGETGTYIYARYVDGVTAPVHWQGQPPEYGTPTHPTRKLLDSPALYEFGNPLPVTYPPLYDLSYWYDGIKPRVNLPNQIRSILDNLRLYGNLFIELDPSLQPSLDRSWLIALAILWFVSRRKWAVLKDIAQYWVVWAVPLAALGMFMIIHVELRYIAPFAVLVVLALFASVRHIETQEIRLLVTILAVITLLIWLLPLGYTFVPELPGIVRGQDNPANLWEWQVSAGLKQAGLPDGSKLGFIGTTYHFDWARMSGARIVAEIRQPGRENLTPIWDSYPTQEIPLSNDVDKFWAADSSVKAKVMQTFVSAGANAVVTDQIPQSADANGWQQVGKTSYYVYFLD